MAACWPAPGRAGGGRGGSRGLGSPVSVQLTGLVAGFRSDMSSLGSTPTPHPTAPLPPAPLSCAPGPCCSVASRPALGGLKTARPPFPGLSFPRTGCGWPLHLVRSRHTVGARVTGQGSWVEAITLHLSVWVAGQAPPHAQSHFHTAGAGLQLWRGETFREAAAGGEGAGLGGWPWHAPSTLPSARVSVTVCT